jgi:hypothetical protein
VRYGESVRNAGAPQTNVKETYGNQSKYTMIDRHVGYGKEGGFNWLSEDNMYIRVE